MRFITQQILPCILWSLVIMTGCKKEDGLLNEKPNEALNTPSTLQDLQLLLNNEDIFNRFYPAFGETSSDDYYFDYGTWLSTVQSERNAYIWAKDIYPGTDYGDDWVYPYQMVYYANTVLSALPKISIGNKDQTQYKAIKGSALFYRSVAFYNLLQEFAPPYQQQSAPAALGVPLPMVPDLAAKVPRSPLAACYQQMINDLDSCVTLLPDLPPIKTAASKAAVYALLSRIYLVMSDYTKSLNFATQCLNLNNTLQDFNKLDPNAFPVFPAFSPEEVFHAGVDGFFSTSNSSQVDSTLLKAYDDPNDLRPAIFFLNNGSYIQFNSQFDKYGNVTYSFSTAEMLLNKAECEARLNDPVSALNDLNTLLTSRWKSGTYQAVSGLNADQSLGLILKERRKELVMTTLRWSDLRRLNPDGRFAVTLKRVLNGITYELPPNDPRYVLPIPPNELRLNPIPQNIR